MTPHPRIPSRRTVAQLQHQARHQDLIAEQVQTLLAALHTAITTLPPRLADADWGTTTIDRAAVDLAAAAGPGLHTTSDLAAIDERLQHLQAAAAAAEQLGARVAELGAAGSAAAFTETAVQQPGLGTGDGRSDREGMVRDPLAPVVAEYDRLARTEPYTRVVDQRLTALHDQLCDAGVDMPAYLDAAVERLQTGRPYLTLVTYLRHQARPAHPSSSPRPPVDEPLSVDQEERLVATLLAGLVRTGHRDGVLDQIRRAGGEADVATVLQAEAGGRARIGWPPTSPPPPVSAPQQESLMPQPPDPPTDASTDRPVTDPSPAQIDAAVRAWHEWFDQPTGRITAADRRTMAAVLTAPTVYAALCAMSDIDPDDGRRWEFAGDSYRAAEHVRAVAAQIRGQA